MIAFGTVELDESQTTDVSRAVASWPTTTRTPRWTGIFRIPPPNQVESLEGETVTEGKELGVPTSRSY